MIQRSWRDATGSGALVCPGAMWRDRDQLDAWAQELPRDRPVVAYCSHGRSGSAGVVDRLREVGFEAALLEGGFEGWKAAGGQLVPGREDASTGGAADPSDADALVHEASEDSFPASDPEPEAHSFDAGLTYLLNPRLQLDLSAGVGLSGAAPDWFVGTGVAFRVPR